MNRNPAAFRYAACVAAALACATAMVVEPPDREAPGVQAISPPDSSLDCTRITSQRLLEPDLLIDCVVVARSPSHRLARVRRFPPPHRSTVRLASCCNRPRSRITRAPWSRATTPALASAANSRVTCSR